MADGDQYKDRLRDQGSFAGALLIDNVPHTKATENVYTGPWVDISAIREGTVQVEVHSALTGTVNIEGTNVANPDANSPAFAAADTQTAAGAKALNLKPVRWVRARVSGFTAGTLSVHLHGVV